MITAGLATFHQRDATQTIKSLINQVDNIHVYCNDKYTYSKLKDTFNNKVKLYTGENLGDSGKFYHVPEGYYFGCDDDLIYPDDYIKVSLSHLKIYPIISYHGRLFHQIPINSYYKDSATKYRCLDDVDKIYSVHVAGTGCIGFHTDTIKPNIKDFENGFMADIWFAQLAKEIPLVVCPHHKEWIKYIPQKDTIHQRHKNNDYIQTDVINQLILSQLRNADNYNHP